MTESALLRADPRLKIIVAVGLGVLTWKAGLPGLVLYLAALSWGCWVLRAALPGQRHVLKSYGWFLTLWVLAKVCLALWDGSSANVAAAAGAMLGLRLTCLLLVGLLLALSTSPRALGRALTWFMRPIMGKNAWQAALALALMVHFLPITWLTLAEIRQSVQRRCAHVGLFRRMLIVGQASLRSLGQKTWNQTLAVACRRLDRPQAWNQPLETHPVQWGMVVLILAAALMLARL